MKTILSIVYISASISPTPQPIDFFQAQKDLASQVINGNALYLSIAVAILVLLGAVFYFINFKPFQKKIDKQEETIKTMNSDFKDRFFKLSDENSSQLDKFRNLISSSLSTLKVDIDDRIDVIHSEIDSKAFVLEEEFLEKFETNKKEITERINKEVGVSINDLKRKYQGIELDVLWDKQYIWSHVPANQLPSLVNYLEVAIRYNMLTPVMKELCLKNISQALDRIKNDGLKIHEYQHSSLVNVLNKINDFSELKIEILNKAQELLSK